jgi:uncharacterized protein (TIGR03435 family)
MNSQSRLAVALVGLVIANAGAALVHSSAQSPAPPSRAPLEFDVASIKRNMSGPEAGSRAQTLGGGTTQLLTNGPIPIRSAAPEDVRPADVVNAPGWLTTEYYDITVKAPAGSTRDQIREMWHTLFVQRMKLVAHVEHREVKAFGLVLADGRPGPELKKSALDCSALASATSPVAGPSIDKATRCGFGLTSTSIVSGGATMDVLARIQLSPLAGAPVTNRTGLEGYYAFTLKFRAPHPAGAAAPDDDLPDLFTALREQLGLKLETEKATEPYWVIDHIERPEEN